LLNELIELNNLAGSGKRVADNIYERIVSIKARNTSPVILGGPRGDTVFENGNQVKWWGVRHTAVRGVWRWWIRAILSGIAWENGYNLDYKDMSKLEAKIGLGTVKGLDNKDGESSRVILRISSKINFRPINKNRFSGRLLNPNQARNCYGNNRGNYTRSPACHLLSISRYYMLTLGGNGEVLFRKQPIPPQSLEIEISILARREIRDWVKKLLILALGLALTKGGIGQMTSRGFGKFEILEMDPKNDVPPSIFKKPLGEIVKDKLKQICKERDVENLLNGERSQKTKNKELSKIPTLHQDVLRSEVVDTRVKLGSGNAPAQNVWDILIAVGGATLKANWKANYRQSGRNYHTWPLGLPRFVRNQKTGIITGYAFPNNPGRLTSLLRAVPVKDEGKWKTELFMFYTEDLERCWSELDHLSRQRGSRLQRTRVSKITQNKRPRELADEAFEKVKSLLQRGV